MFLLLLGRPGQRSVKWLCACMSGKGTAIGSVPASVSSILIKLTFSLDFVHGCAEFEGHRSGLGLAR